MEHISAIIHARIAYMLDLHALKKDDWSYWI